LTTINNIIFDGYWLNSSKNVTSVGWPELPLDIHVSFSHASNSDYYNIHVTKNNGPQTGKPKIEIFRIEKKVCEEVPIHLARKAMEEMLEPFNLHVHRVKGSTANYGFITLKQMSGALTGRLSELFKQNSEIKRKRLRIKKEITDRMAKYCALQSTRESISRKLKKIPKRSGCANMQAWLLNQHECHTLVRINYRWYRVRPIPDMNSVLSCCMPPELMDELKRRFKMALAHLENAGTYGDVKLQDDRFILEKSRNS